MKSSKKATLIVMGGLILAFALCYSCAGSKKGAVPCPSYKQHPHHTGYHTNPAQQIDYRVAVIC